MRYLISWQLKISTPLFLVGTKCICTEHLSVPDEPLLCGNILSFSRPVSSLKALAHSGAGPEAAVFFFCLVTSTE